jgi:signal transduction histidine kinase
MGATAVAPLALPRDRHGPAPVLVAALAVAGCAAAVAAYSLTFDRGEGPNPRVDAVLVAWITVSYTVCGLIAWSRRPTSRFGPLMVAAGFAPLLSRLSAADSGFLYTMGDLLRLLPVVLFPHLFLAYPSGRLQTRAERALVAAAYAVAVGLAFASLLLGGSGTENVLAIAERPAAADAVQLVQRAGVAAFVLVSLGVLLGRRRLVGRPLRHSRDLLLWSFVGALATMSGGLLLVAFGGPAAHVFRWVAFALIGVAPVLLLGGLMRARLARSAVGDLLVDLPGEPQPAALRDALARALGDPSLRLVYWMPQFGTYADLDGRAVAVTESVEGRAVTYVDRGGIRVAALLHEPALLDEPELLAAVTAAAAIAIENAQLHVELRARVEELRGSRARIVEASDDQRRRLERNLHDGAQHRLVALALELGVLEDELADDPARHRLTHARDEVKASLDELREIAQGLHPAVVSDHGLAVALEELAACAAVPVRLSVKLAARLPRPHEVAAYYVVSESLANVGKYAHASQATIEVERSNGHVRVEVVDDGVGGADTERGTGLRGLADRVEALGGRVRVWSPRGGGTRVRADIPCA